MKKILALLLLFGIVGFISLAVTFYLIEFTPQQNTIEVTEKLIPISYQERKDLERNKQQQIILIGLVARCEKFGWTDADDVASCVQQEAYRDLQLEKQKYQIKALEQKIILAENLSQKDNSFEDIDEEPLFLFFLNAYADTKNIENMNQMKKDISTLKSKSTYSGSSAEAALKSLYRDND